MAVLVANVAELERLGWREGANLRVDRRYAASDPARLREIAVELVGLAPDVVETVGTLATSIMHEATRSIPIVFWAVGDPVELGLVSSLAHPGGNATGLALFGTAIGGKWVQILKEGAPRVLRAGYMFNPDTSQPARLIAGVMNLVQVKDGTKFTRAISDPRVGFSATRLRHGDASRLILFSLNGNHSPKAGGSNPSPATKNTSIK
jgi:hypothetical protein